MQWKIKVVKLGDAYQVTFTNMNGNKFQSEQILAMSLSEVESWLDGWVENISDQMQGETKKSGHKRSDKDTSEK